MSAVEGGDAGDERVVLVAAAKLLAEYPPLQANTQLWGALRDEARKRVEGEEGVGGGAAGP